MSSASGRAAQTRQPACTLERRAGGVGVFRRHLQPPRSCQRRRGSRPPTRALFEAIKDGTIFKDFSLFRGAPQEEGRLVERPLYRPADMRQMGPFKVSPMGFGTWSWVSGGMLLHLCCSTLQQFESWPQTDSRPLRAAL